MLEGVKHIYAQYAIVKEDGSIVYQDYVRATGNTVVHALAVTDRGDIMIGTDDGYLKLIFNPESKEDHRDSRAWVKTDHVERINIIVPFLNPYGGHAYFIGYDKDYYEIYGIDVNDNIWNHYQGGRLDNKENRISSGVDLGNQEIFITTNSNQIGETKQGHGGDWEIINYDGKFVRKGTIFNTWESYLLSCELLPDGNVFVLSTKHYAIVDPRTGETLYKPYIMNSMHDSELINNNEVVVAGDGGEWKIMKFGNLINNEYSIDVDSFNLQYQENNSIKYDVNINRSNEYTKRPNDKIDDFKIKTTLTPEEGSNTDTIVNVSQIFSGNGKKTIDAIDGLKKGVTYNVELTLLDSAGKETYSPKGNTIEKHKMNDQVIIPAYEHHINDISSAKVDYTHIGDETFDFSMTTNDDGSQYDVSPYKVNVYADHNGTTSDLIWTSKELTHGLRNEFFTVNNLSYGETYSNISYSLYDISEQSEIGSIFKTCETVSFLPSVIGIKDVDLDQGTQPTISSFNINLTTEDSGDKEFSPYKIKVIADYGDKIQEVIWTSENQTNGKRNELITVDGLMSSTKYSNIRVELVDSSTGNIIGSESQVIGSITTALDGPTSIINATINNSTSKGFDFSMDIEGSSDWNTSYKIQALTGGGSILWTSDEQKEVGTKSFSVENLIEGNRYNDINFQLVSTKDTGKIYGEKFDTKIDIIPTDNRVQGINSGGAKIIGQSSSWFSFLLDVNSTNQTNNFVSPYRVMLFQNGDDSNPIWISNERLTVGRDLKFDVNLNKEEYKNIQVQIIDVNTLDKIGDSSTMNELKHNLSAGAISGIVIGSLTILVMIILALTFIVREILKNYYNKRKTYNDQYMNRGF